jgi:hypothetical protein
MENKYCFMPLPTPDTTEQYRAIGFVTGVYIPGVENPSKGVFLKSDDKTLFPAHLTWQLKNWIKKNPHVDLGAENCYSVYIRNSKEEPFYKLSLTGIETTDGTKDEFSIRGVIVVWDLEKQEYKVEVKRNILLKKEEKDKFENRPFRVTVHGKIPAKMRYAFCDIKCQLKDKKLQVKKIKFIVKKAPRKKKRFEKEAEPKVLA